MISLVPVANQFAVVAIEPALGILSNTNRISISYKTSDETDIRDLPIHYLAWR
jgi:hypothetical protein